MSSLKWTHSYLLYLGGAWKHFLRTILSYEETEVIRLWSCFLGCSHRHSESLLDYIPDLFWHRLVWCDWFLHYQKIKAVLSNYMVLITTEWVIMMLIIIIIIMHQLFVSLLWQNTHPSTFWRERFILAYSWFIVHHDMEGMMAGIGSIWSYCHPG